MKGVNSRCVKNCTLHGSKMRPLVTGEKRNEIVLNDKMRMIRQMYSLLLLLLLLLLLMLLLLLLQLLLLLLLLLMLLLLLLLLLMLLLLLIHQLTS